MKCLTQKEGSTHDRHRLNLVIFITLLQCYAGPADKMQEKNVGHPPVQTDRNNGKGAKGVVTSATGLWYRPTEGDT